LPRRNTDQETEAPSQLQIYDTDNNITLYWTTSHSKIIQIEIEDESIYYLAQNANGQIVLCKLYEMEDNVKIQNLMKKSLYQEARRIAVASKFPMEIIAEIHKEHADKLYS
jgi:L-cysteine desulfidase